MIYCHREQYSHLALVHYITLHVFGKCFYPSSKPTYNKCIPKVNGTTAEQVG